MIVCLLWQDEPELAKWQQHLAQRRKDEHDSGEMNSNRSRVAWRRINHSSLFAGQFPAEHSHEIEVHETMVKVGMTHTILTTSVGLGKKCAEVTTFKRK